MLALVALVAGGVLATASSAHRHRQRLVVAENGGNLGKAVDLLLAPLPEDTKQSPRLLASLSSAQIAAVRRLAALGIPLYCGGRRRRLVALTFDDGPGVYTRLALKKLQRAHMPATFFLVGRAIRAWPRLPRLEKPLAAFGDHTMTHPFLPALPRPEMTREIGQAKLLIERAVGEPILLFRPPYEGRTPAIDRGARALRMLEVLWNVDSQDSLGADYADIERNVIAGLRPGAIILMHENHGQTIRALDTIFAALARAHLKAVTVPQLVAEDPPSPRQLRAGTGGCGRRRGLGNGS